MASIEEVIENEGEIIYLKKNETFRPCDIFGIPDISNIPDVPIVGKVLDGILLETVYAPERTGILVYSKAQSHFVLKSDQNPVTRKSYDTHYVPLLSNGKSVKISVIPYDKVPKNALEDWNELIFNRLKMMKMSSIFQTKHLPEKVLFALYQLTDLTPEIQEISITQTNIAKIVTASRENISLVLPTFYEKGILEGAKRGQLLVNRKRLEKALSSVFSYP